MLKRNLTDHERDHEQHRHLGIVIPPSFAWFVWGSATFHNLKMYLCEDEAWVQRQRNHPVRVPTPPTYDELKDTAMLQNQL